MYRFFIIKLYGAIILCAVLYNGRIHAQTQDPVPVDISTFGPTTTFNGSNNIQPGGDLEANRIQILTGNPAPIRRIDLLFDMSTTETGLQGLVVSIWSDSGTAESYPLAPIGNTFDYLPNTSFNNGVHRFASFYSNPTPQTSTFTFPGAGNYWIVVGPSTEKVNWAKTSSTTSITNSIVPPSAAVDPIQLQYSASSNKWQGPSGGQGNQIMALGLSTVPEPSTYVLGLIVAGVLAMSARLKLSRNKRPVASCVKA